MRLLRCHVDHFGCLSDYELTFSPGLTQLRAENGFGKTTLIQFIVSMLYGLPTGSGSAETNRRKKYAPWQGGVYGGWLEYETEAGQFRAVRRFGARSVSGDSFALYTLPELHPVKTTSGNPGQELFALSESSFRRCVCMDSGAAENLSASDVQARLNRLVEDTNDINNLDTALERLREERRQMLPYRGSGGSLARLESAIAEAQAEQKRLEGLSPRLEEELQAQSRREAALREKERLYRQWRERLIGRGQTVAQDALRREGQEKEARVAALREELRSLPPEKSGRGIVALLLASILVILFGVVHYILRQQLAPVVICIGAGLLLFLLSLLLYLRLRMNGSTVKARRVLLEEELDEATEALTAFRREYGELPPEEAPAEDPETVTARGQALERELAELRRTLAAGEQSILRLRSEQARLPEVTSGLEELKRRRREERDTCRLLDKTMELLFEAGEELSHSYLHRLQAALVRNLELLGEDSDSFLLDGHLELTREVLGEPRSASTESSGGSTVLMLALRLALAEALFEGDVPFLLLDDPFTELDEKHMERAKAVLREKAEQYQIIYMVCHSTREI